MTQSLYVNDNQEKNNASTLPIPASVFNPEDVKDELAQSGLQGLSFNFSSFPVMTLKDGFFRLSADEEFNQKQFDIKILKTTEKHILVDLKDSNYPDVKYSNNGISTVDGEDLETIKEKMIKEGRTPKLKRYIDILCQLKIDGKHYDKIAILSVSPTSVSIVSGFFLQLKVQGLISQLNELTITVKRGMQRTSKGGSVYHLWSFDVKQDVQAVA